MHPDKNMGNPLACESFKKLQCAYEASSLRTSYCFPSIPRILPEKELLI